MWVKRVAWYSLVLCFLILIQNNVSVANDDDEDVGLKKDLQKLFEKFFKKVITVIKGKDPFNYPGFQFNNYNSYGVRCKGHIDDLSLLFLSTIELTKLKVTDNPLYFEFGIGFTRLQLIVKYDIDFDFLTMFPLFGKGDFGAAINNINNSVVMNIDKGEEGEAIQLQTLNLNITAEKFKVDIKNLLDNPALSKYISYIISDISADILSILGTLVQFVQDSVKKVLNNYLRENNITFDKIIEIVKQIVQ